MSLTMLDWVFALAGPVLFLGLGIYLAKRAGKLMHPVFYLLIAGSLVGGLYASEKWQDSEFTQTYGAIVSRCLPAASFTSDESSPVPGKHETSAGSLQKKIVLTNADGSRFHVPVYSKLDLPADAFDGGPDSVKTVVFIQTTKQEAGHYTGGIAAYRVIYHLCAVDAQSQKVIARATLIGEPPTEVRRNIIGVLIPPGNTGLNSANQQLAEWLKNKMS